MNMPGIIVSELSRSDEERVRCSTCVALSTLGGPEDLARLAQIGLEDSSDSVRAAVAAEVSALSGEARDRLVSLFHEALDSSRHRAAAYDILCMMRANGADVAEKRNSLFKRLRRFQNTRRLRAARKEMPRFEPLNSCLVGTVIAYFAVLFLTLALAPAGVERAEELDVILLAFALVVFVCSYIMLLKSGPAGWHFDRTAERIGEILGAGIKAAFIGAIVVIAVIAFGLAARDDDWEWYMLAALVLIVAPSFLLASAIRFGSLLGLESSKRTRPNHAFSTAVGSSTGVLVATLGAGFMGITDTGSRLSEVGSGIWLFASVFSISLSYVFVTRDHYFGAQVTIARPGLRWMAFASAPALAVVMAIIVLLVGIARPVETPIDQGFVDVQRITVAGMGADKTVQLSKREAIQVTVDQNRCLRFLATPKEYGPSDPVVFLSAKDKRNISDVGRWGELSRTLEPGTYTLTVVPDFENVWRLRRSSIDDVLQADWLSGDKLNVDNIFPVLLSHLQWSNQDQKIAPWNGAELRIELVLGTERCPEEQFE